MLEIFLVYLVKDVAFYKHNDQISYVVLIFEVSSSS